MAVLVDAQVAGISGDMLVCAMVDMGASASRVRDAVRGAAALLPGGPALDAAFERVAKRGIAATRMVLSAEGGGGLGGRHSVPDLRRCVSDGCAAAGLSDAASSLASAALAILVESEAAVHGSDAASAHLHEAAGLDTVADIVGAAAAADDLGIAGEPAACTPVAVGCGTVTFSHGTTPCPAPAVVEALRGSGIATCPGGAPGSPPRAELATPTGVALLRAMRPECAAAYPEMAIEAVGHGAGSADFGGFANVLRLVRGAAPGDAEVGHGSVGVLETLVDDATGEEIGRAVEAVSAAGGALDAWASPAVGRKGRPAHAITVVCEAGAEARLARMLMAETGTLGVRARRSGRLEAGRSERTVGVRLRGSEYAVRAKRSAATGREKPESDDVAAAAAAAGVPYMEASRAAAAAAAAAPAAAPAPASAAGRDGGGGGGEAGGEAGDAP